MLTRPTVHRDRQSVKNYRTVQRTEKAIGRSKLKDAKKNETRANRGVTDMEKEAMIRNRDKTGKTRRK